MQTQEVSLLPKQVTVKKLTSKTLIEKRKELSALIKETESILSYINSELHVRILKDGTDKKLQVDGAGTAYLVERPTFKDVKIEVGAKLNALKTVLDTTKLSSFLKEEMKAKKVKTLKELVDKGSKVKGVNVTEYVMVK